MASAASSPPTTARARLDLLVTVPCTAAPPMSSAHPASAMHRLRPHGQAHAADAEEPERLPSATRPTFRLRKPDRSPTSRPRSWWRTSFATSPNKELVAGYDGHANCFIETGFHKALLIDFNYDTEPLPGRFPDLARAATAALASHTSTISASCSSRRSTGTRCSPAARIPGLGPTMPTAGKSLAHTS